MVIVEVTSILFSFFFHFFSLVNGSGENLSCTKSHGEGSIPCIELRRRQVNLLGIHKKVLNSD